MNKQIQEMVEEYRHLFFLLEKNIENGAYNTANKLTEQIDQLTNNLRELGYPVRSLIEEVKYETKRLKKYNHVVIFSDGGVRNHHDSNQESKAASAFIVYGDKKILKQQGEYIGSKYTLPSSGLEVEINSTLAEYAGLLQGIEHILKNHIAADRYIFVTDCIVMVEQILDKRKPTNPAFQECLQVCKEKMLLLGNVEIKHVTREMNRVADAFVNDILNNHERVKNLC